MATLALPINALLPVVNEARAETECVVVCSKAEPTDRFIVVKIAWKTLALRRRFADLAHRQTGLIDSLVQRDFSTVATEHMEDLAIRIDELVAEEKDVLEKAHGLGSEIRAWWYSSLIKLSDQLEYLDSIAESLHVASDHKASTLMGVAVGQFTEKAKAAGQLATK